MFKFSAIRQVANNDSLNLLTLVEPDGNLNYLNQNPLNILLRIVAENKEINQD